jgi:hypothetical protein
MHKLHDELVHTRWFSPNLLLMLGISVPMWFIAGMAWGLFMHLGLGGHLIGWLITGVFWGICCGLFFCICLFVVMREIALRVPLRDSAKLAERLGEAASPQKYAVEQNSPALFVCKPRFGLARLLCCNQVAIQVEGGALLLTGPAGIVKKIRRRL